MAEAGPALQLLAAALRLWIRQQCDAIGSLELELEGSALQLLRGHLAGVRLQARQVRYQGLELEQVALRSEPIQLQLGGLLRGQPLQLDQPFAIRGQVRFTPEGLGRSLRQDAWQPLADSLAETLLGSSPLLGVALRQHGLVFTARPPAGSAAPVLELATLLQAEQGSVALRAADGSTAMLLPMDPAIRIERAGLEQGLVLLEGEATVTP